MFVSSMKKPQIAPMHLSKAGLRNLFSLKLHIYFLTVLGIVPFKKDSTQSKIYAVIILGTFIMATIITAIFLFFIFPSGYSFLEKFIEAATISFLCVFYCSLLYSNRKCRCSWRTLLIMLCKFDESFKMKILSSNEKILTTLKFVTIQSLPLLYYVSYLIIGKLKTDLNSLNGYLFYVTQGVGFLYEVYLSAFLWEMASVLQSRYNHLDKRLKDILLNKLPCQQITHYAFEYNIVMLKNKYKLLHIAVRELNVIFGWLILLILIHLTAAFLMNFYDTIYTSEQTLQFYIEGFSFATFVTVSCFKKVLFFFNNGNHISLNFRMTNEMLSYSVCLEWSYGEYVMVNMYKPRTFQKDMI